MLEPSFDSPHATLDALRCNAGAGTNVGAERESTQAHDMSAAVLARHPTKFQVANVAADPLTGRHLAVAGLHDLQVCRRLCMLCHKVL